MKLRSLKLTNFMSHDATTLFFPEAGIVVFTGDNGSGKSSVAEALSVASHGKTLRGSPPWRKGVAGSVELTSAEIAIKRSITSSGKVSLVWEQGQDARAAFSVTALSGSPVYETTTKAQDALARVVGSFDVWRRASVFSSSDAEHFTLATDGERKRLLEDVLGVDRFSSALEACRIDLKTATQLLRMRESDAQTKRHALSSAELLKQGAIDSLAQLKPPIELHGGDVAAIDSTLALGGVEGIEAAIDVSPLTKNGRSAADVAILLNESRSEIALLREKQAKLSSQGGGDEARAEHVDRQLRRIANDTCPTCLQAIPDELRASLEAEALEARAASREARKAGLEAASGLAEALAEAGEEERELSRLHEELRSQTQLALRARDEARRYINQKLRFEQILQESDSSIAKLDTELGELQALVASLQKEVEILAAVETVLGLKGVRAHVLGKALAGIEHVANTWLTRLKCEGLSVKLSPYSEKKSGGVSDAISLTVEGAGDGYGYRAASGGERRRLDIAILLALGEVAEAANGRSGGVLICDELFDALDVAGVEAVSEVLAEISKERLVIVITHNTLLVKALNGAKHYHVDRGVVTEVV